MASRMSTRAVPAGAALAELAAAARQPEHAAADSVCASGFTSSYDEAGERDARLDRRAGRIGAAQRAVEQRPVDVSR